MTDPYYCRFGYFHPVVRLAEECRVHDPEAEGWEHGQAVTTPSESGTAYTPDA